MDKVFIHNLLVRGIIGINDWEREKEQDILINITMVTNTLNAGHSDDIKDCVNYRTVAKKVIAHTETIKRFTVEALAEDVAQICLKEQGVHGVIVRIEKPGALRFAESVGVEIRRGKVND